MYFEGEVKKVDTMKNLFFILSFFMITSCNAQEKNKDAITSEPYVDVKVNKKYDDKGNLVHYDSTYTYIYRDGSGTDQMPPDSLFSHFRSFFFNNHETFVDKHFDRLFFNDSLMEFDFMQPDFFHKRFELNGQHFDQMFRELDSLKNQYFKENFPKGEMRKTKEIKM